MARKPNPKTVVTEPAQLPAERLQQHQLAAAAVTDQAIGWVEAAQTVGGLKMASFFATVADRVVAETYERLKESKTYVGMPYRTEGGEVATVATLEEACRVFLGKSQRRCEEVAANRRLLGPELYEQAEALKLSQRDYNAIRALPADGQLIIKEAIEGTTDRKVVVEKLVSLVEQQSIEKMALAKERDKLRGDYSQAQTKVAEKNQRIEKLDDEIHALKRQWRSAKPDEKRATLQSAITEHARLIVTQIQSLRGMARELAQLAPDDTTADHLGVILAELLMHVKIVRDDDTLPIAIPILQVEGGEGA